MGLVERRNIYGRNDFEKDRRGITYHIERAASCGAYDIETVKFYQAFRKNARARRLMAYYNRIMVQ